MTGLLIVNVVLFLHVVVGGIAMSWFGWMLAGRGGEGDGGGGRRGELGPVQPPWPSPVKPGGSAGPDDLARSA